MSDRVRSIGSGLRRDERGTIVIMAALALPVIIGCAALAVDVGTLFLERRHAQGAADLAAIAGAADIEHAADAAEATLRANGIVATTSLAVTKGHYDANAAIPAAERFRPGVTPYNAVHVALTKPGRLYFAKALLGSPPTLGVKALATTAAQATFSIGSRLLAVRDGIPNALLGALLGGNINLSVMDYDALLNADIKLVDFLDALATRVNITAGTYNDVLDSTASVKKVAEAAASVTSAGGDARATAALQTIASQGGAQSLTLPLRSLIDLGAFGNASIGSKDPGLNAGFDALEIANAAAALANGKNQVAVNLGAGVPGLLNVTLDVAIGEPAQHSPWATVGQPGATVATAQTRVRLTAEVGGTGLLSGVRIRLPVYVDIASAQATLTALTCQNAAANEGTATIAARPGIVRAWIGDVTGGFSNFAIPASAGRANIVDTGLIKVRGSAYAEMTNVSDTLMDFTQADVAARTVKRTDTRNFTETLVSTLLGKLDLDVQIAGLPLISPQVVTALVANILAQAARPLDQVLYTVLTALGVHLGEADVRVHGIRCGASVLTG
ncbi:MAG: pilus assembly protein TadG-related protein [Hyphomicrobiaceae bacterium]